MYGTSLDMYIIKYMHIYINITVYTSVCIYMCVYLPSLVHEYVNVQYRYVNVVQYRHY